MGRARWRLYLTCEHGGNRIPGPYASLFAGQARLLASHRGWDEGALVLARRLAKVTGAPLQASRVSRLLVDLNRSPGHRGVFSDITERLDPEERALLIERFHRPHRAEGEAWLRAAATKGPVLHIAVHSFTPVLDGVRRRADVGVLYDPRRATEARLARAWKRKIAEQAPQLSVRSNQPYRGASDGWTTTLRKLFPEERYVGIELEMNQRLVASDWRASCGVIERALLELLAELDGSGV